ncbi:MAG: hypothetical protein F6K41_09540 [Symploca sp. SIO3E6]|nr:hypothetical protein [Caldora sp. SIO3E6]
MYQLKLADTIIPVSEKPQQLVTKLSVINGEKPNKKGKLASRWVRDENSKLYCQWFIE